MINYSVANIFKFDFSQKYCTKIHTTNDEIKTEGYTFSLVEDVEETCFLMQS